MLPWTGCFGHVARRQALTKEEEETLFLATYTRGVSLVVPLFRGVFVQQIQEEGGGGKCVGGEGRRKGRNSLAPSFKRRKDVEEKMARFFVTGSIHSL